MGYTTKKTGVTGLFKTHEALFSLGKCVGAVFKTLKVS